MNTKLMISTILAALLTAGTVSAEGLLHLSWAPDYDAVKYDVIFSRLEAGKLVKEQETTAYMSDMLLPQAGRLRNPSNLYWQERPLDFDGFPIGNESSPQRLADSVTEISRNAPLPRPDRSGERGGALLYPVYSYIGNPGTASYEIEVLSAYPEDTEGSAHSI